MEDIGHDVIHGLKIPIGTLSVYVLDANLKPIPKPIPNEASSRLVAIPSVPS